MYQALYSNIFNITSTTTSTTGGYHTQRPKSRHTPIQQINSIVVLYSYIIFWNIDNTYGQHSVFENHS